MEYAAVAFRPVGDLDAVVARAARRSLVPDLPALESSLEAAVAQDAVG
jgi:hypothetical protein